MQYFPTGFIIVRMILSDFETYINDILHTKKVHEVYLTQSNLIEIWFTFPTNLQKLLMIFRYHCTYTGLQYSQQCNRSSVGKKTANPSTLFMSPTEIYKVAVWNQINLLLLVIYIRKVIQLYCKASHLYYQSIVINGYCCRSNKNN